MHTDNTEQEQQGCYTLSPLEPQLPLWATWFLEVGSEKSGFFFFEGESGWCVGKHVPPPYHHEFVSHTPTPGTVGTADTDLTHL